jgi:hypothetical protein
MGRKRARNLHSQGSHERAFETKVYHPTDHPHPGWANDSKDDLFNDRMYEDDEFLRRWPTSAGPRTDVDCQASHCTYKNLWYNGCVLISALLLVWLSVRGQGRGLWMMCLVLRRGRWYALVDGPIPGGTFPITKRTRVNSLHVISPTTWLKSVQWAVVPGDTVVLDFIHLTHPTAIGTQISCMRHSSLTTKQLHRALSE